MRVQRQDGDINGAVLRNILMGVMLGATLAAGFPADAQVAPVQKVTPVPTLDPKRLTGIWYEVSRYPTKFEARCAGQATVLFAEGDKPRSIQIGTFCPGKNGSPQEYATTGKMDKKGDGKITFGLIWPFTQKYWVVALAPDYSWALAADPKRKTLSVLARTPELEPATLATIGAQATAQGFKLDKLVSLPKQGKTYKVQDGQLKMTPAAPAIVKPKR